MTINELVESNITYLQFRISYFWSRNKEPLKSIHKVDGEIA